MNNIEERLKIIEEEQIEMVKLIRILSDEIKKLKDIKNEY